MGALQASALVMSYVGLDMTNSIQSGAMAHRETFNLTDIFRKEDNCGFF